MSKPSGGLGRGLGAFFPQPETQEEPLKPAQVANQSQVSEDGKVRVHFVDPHEIEVNPHQPRTYFDPGQLEDLMNSIKEHGILQPLVVTERGDGKYELIAGERRLRASRNLGLATVPVLVRSANQQQKLELALIENIQRADLNVVEEARAYQAMIDLFHLSHVEVGERVGKSRPVISNSIRLLELDPIILDALVEGKILRSHARSLLAEPNPNKRMELFEQFLKGEINHAQLTNVAGFQKRLSQPRKRKEVDPNVAHLENELRSHLGTKVRISLQGAAGAVTIHFYSKEEMKDLIARLTNE